MQIPKVIHQTWGSEDLTPLAKASRKSLQRDYPDYEHRLWVDEEIFPLIPNFLVDKFKGSPKISQFDIGRYAILHEHGGLYFDLDMLSSKRVEVMEDFVGYKAPRKKGHHLANVRGWTLGNAFFGCTPNHPLMAGVLKETSITTSEDVLIRTGPECLDRVYRRSSLPLQLLEDGEFFTHHCTNLGRNCAMNCNLPV